MKRILWMILTITLISSCMKIDRASFISEEIPTKKIVKQASNLCLKEGLGRLVSISREFGYGFSRVFEVTCFKGRFALESSHGN